LLEIAHDQLAELRIANCDRALYIDERQPCAFPQSSPTLPDRFREISGRLEEKAIRTPRSGDRASAKMAR
jgi:hypothetical protein